MKTEKCLRDLVSKSGLSINEITLLGYGDDSEVYLADGLYVIKIPKREEVKASQAREFLLYDYLDSFAFDFEVPKTVFKSENINIMTYISGGHISYNDYQKLDEREKDLLAYDEARFLLQLHSVEVDYKNSLFCQAKQNKKEDFISERNFIISVLREKKLLSTQMFNLLEGIYDILLRKTYLFDYNFCLTHNDFSSDNMVFKKNRLVGVVDFGDFLVGDPDNDFLCLLDNSRDDFGKDFGRRVLKYYGPSNPEVAERKAELNDLYYPCKEIIYGYKRKNDRLLQNGYSELKKTNIDSFED